jgi:hypothetical protein
MLVLPMLQEVDFQKQYIQNFFQLIQKDTELWYTERNYSLLYCAPESQCPPSVIHSADSPSVCLSIADTQSATSAGALAQTCPACLQHHVHHVTRMFVLTQTVSHTLFAIQYISHHMIITNLLSWFQPHIILGMFSTCKSLTCST